MSRRLDFDACCNLNHPLCCFVLLTQFQGGKQLSYMFGIVDSIIKTNLFDRFAFWKLFRKLIISDAVFFFFFDMLPIENSSTTQLLYI